MRTHASVVLLLGVLLSACKDNKKAGDAGPTADAPPYKACTTTAGSNVTFRKIGKVDDAAMLATAPTGDGRLFVVENQGTIRIFEAETLKPTPYLDVRLDAGGRVVAGGEQGLLGLAFHPNFAVNRQFFVFYTADNPDSGGDQYVNVVERYTQSATDPNVADKTSATVILSIPDFAGNHNGGMIEFGSDGFLYIGTGDGGGGGDPRRNGQNTNALLGKILRIDVDAPANGKPYGIPPSNPFPTGVGGAPEVFIFGLRNPWRWTFDRANGDMWIGDVGQGRIEEIDYLAAGQQAGKNLGWSAYEGTLCCASSGEQGYNCTQTGSQHPCDTVGKTPPIDERLQADGWRAIVGGQVYRGACYPDLTGWYFYSDNTKHGLHKARVKADKTFEIVDLEGTWPTGPASLHADSRGELFLTTTSGDVYALEVTP